MLYHRLRRWSNITTTLEQRIVFPGLAFPANTRLGTNVRLILVQRLPSIKPALAQRPVCTGLLQEDCRIPTSRH